MELSAPSGECSATRNDHVSSAKPLQWIIDWSFDPQPTHPKSFAGKLFRIEWNLVQQALASPERRSADRTALADRPRYWFMFCFTAACGLCLAEVDGVDYRKNFRVSPEVRRGGLYEGHEGSLWADRNGPSMWEGAPDPAIPRLNVVYKGRRVLRQPIRHKNFSVDSQVFEKDQSERPKTVISSPRCLLELSQTPSKPKLFLFSKTQSNNTEQG